MFGKLLRFEILRKRTIAYFIIMAIVCIVALLCLSFYYVKNANPGKKSLYLMPEYVSQEELNDNISQARQALSEEESELEKASIANAPKNILMEKEKTIKELKRYINAMEQLSDNNVVYTDAVEYHSFDQQNGPSAIISYVGIIAIIISIFTVFKISTALPNEIKNGQARLTFVQPKGRMRYAICKWAVELAKALCALFVYSLLAFSIVIIIFPIESKYVICSTANYSFALTLFSAFLTQLSFSVFTILICSLSAWGISLLIKNPIISMLCSFAICFSGGIIDKLLQMLSVPIDYIDWILPCNVTIEKCLYIINANSMLLSVLFCCMNVIVLLAISLTCFSRQDVR